jgi:hypothetical protein
LTADFAVGHPEKLTDFGYRAAYGMTIAAAKEKDRRSSTPWPRSTPGPVTGPRLTV